MKYTKKQLVEDNIDLRKENIKLRRVIHTLTKLLEKEQSSTLDVNKRYE